MGTIKRYVTCFVSYRFAMNMGSIAETIRPQRALQRRGDVWRRLEAFHSTGRPDNCCKC